MGAGHTPGPWGYSNGNLIRVNAHGIGVCVAGVHRIGKARDCVQADAVALANARLIAAAPDLLEALEGAIGALEQDYDAGKDQGDADWEGIAFQRLEAARAAIAKATALSRPPEAEV